MDNFKLKINDKYVVGFEETEVEGRFAGEWHNHSKRAITVPLFGEMTDAKIIEGKRNLKSYAERVLNMMSDGFEINNFTFIKQTEETCGDCAYRIDEVCTNGDSEFCAEFVLEEDEVCVDFVKKASNGTA